MNRFRADLVLLLVALIWGSAFAVQRVAAQYFNAFTFNGLRFLLGGFILLPFGYFFRSQLETRPSTTGERLHSSAEVFRRWVRKGWIFILLGGGLIFGAAGFQQLGLETTTAGNAGFITTLYVVLVPILLVIFWRERIHWLSWVGAGIAILGSWLLSTGGTLNLARGDALEIAGSLFWALHVILVSRAVRHMDVLTFSSGQYIIAGIFNLLVGLGFSQPFDGMAEGWWTIIFIGIISTAGGYTLQVLGQKYAPPTDATILLSMEAVFAALTGFIFLGERMESIQLVGCGLIIAAVVFTQIKSAGARSEESQKGHKGEAGAI